MSRSQITLFCDNCGNAYSKDASEYTRNQKLGRKSFCGKACQLSVRRNAGATAYSEKHKGKPINHLKDCANCTKEDNLSRFRYYLLKAQRRKHKCSITAEDIKDVWDKQLGLCAITGLPMVLKYHTQSSRELGLQTASLDRIDSSLGYEIGNIQFVCLAVNLGKGSFSNAEAISFFNSIKAGHLKEYIKTQLAKRVEELYPL